MKNVLAILPALGALAFGGSALGGCVAGLPEGATSPPPAPLSEIQSPAPAPGMVWVAGSWHWRGTDYVWLPGHWESPPPRP